MNDNLLMVSSSPHIYSKATTEGIMRDVVIALMPATLFGIYNFGIRAFIIIAICILSSIAFEALYQKMTNQYITINDYSAVVTGLLLALNLPHSIPYWLPIIGSLVAVVLVKQIFGGLGQNFMNPALAARAFLMVSYAGYMTQWVLDDVATVTPLQALKSTGDMEALWKLFIGNTAGTIGETSALAILIGAIYLLIRKVISVRIPLTCLLTVLIATALFGGRGFDIEYLVYHILGGGLLLGVFFMATDYSTSPITPKGQIIFAIGIGLFTVITRRFSGNAESISFAILFMNLWVPIIERFTIPKAFGEGKQIER